MPRKKQVHVVNYGITGARAVCNECHDWVVEFGNSESVLAEVRQHCYEEGHAVNVWKETLYVYFPADARGSDEEMQPEDWEHQWLGEGK